jgi:hypothetical protein
MKNYLLLTLICFVGQMLRAQDIIPTFNVTVENRTGECLENVTFEVSYVGGGLPLGFDSSQITPNTQGCGYLFANFSTTVAVNGTTITPVKNTLPLNGVNTFDLLLISSHILGISTFDPYQRIAADANKNGMLTTFDIVEFRRLILGVYSQLPNNSSWRFIDRNFDFDNPLQGSLPESIAFSIAAEGNSGFIGVKIGDIDNSAMPELTGESDERSNPFHWLLDDQWVQAGQTLSLQLSPEMAASAVQMALQGDGFEWLSVEGLTEETYHVAADRLSVAWFGNEVPTVKLRAKANKSGYLSDLLHISEAPMSPLAFEAQGQSHEVALRFKATEQDGFQVFQNVPNPAKGSTRIEYFVPQAAEVQLVMYDVTGRTVAEQKASVPAGYQQFLLNDLSRFPSGTTLYYRITANGESVVRTLLTH